MDGPSGMPSVARATPVFMSRSAKIFQNCRICGMCNSQSFFVTFISHGVTLVNLTFFYATLS